MAAFRAIAALVAAGAVGLGSNEPAAAETGGPCRSVLALVPVDEGEASSMDFVTVDALTVPRNGALVFTSTLADDRRAESLPYSATVKVALPPPIPAVTVRRSDGVTSRGHTLEEWRWYGAPRWFPSGLRIPITIESSIDGVRCRASGTLSVSGPVWGPLTIAALGLAAASVATFAYLARRAMTTRSTPAQLVVAVALVAGVLASALSALSGLVTIASPLLPALPLAFLALAVVVTVVSRREPAPA